MNNFNHPDRNFFSLGWLRLVALLLLACSWNAEATAPRIAAKMFGEEVKADILRYQLEPSKLAPKSEGEMLAEIVTVAFKAAGQSPAIELQPSKQLAKYALFNKEVAAVIGSSQDFSEKEKKSYRLVTFYLRGADPQGEPVALIVNKQAARGEELYRAFNKGMQSIIANGKYLELLGKHHGNIPTDYVVRLSRYNPGWK